MPLVEPVTIALFPASAPLLWGTVFGSETVLGLFLGEVMTLGFDAASFTFVSFGSSAAQVFATRPSYDAGRASGNAYCLAFR
jgi:hypothetical protein